MITRRSWFEREPWWARSTASSGTVLAVSLVATTAAGGRLQDHVLVPAVLALSAAVVGPAAARSHHRRWTELEDACLDEHDELVAAERVVRDGAPPASEAQRLIAVRITELRWKELGGWWSLVVLGAAASALLVAALVQSPWWFLLLLPVVVAAVVTGGQVVRLAGRRSELSPPLAVVEVGAPPKAG